MSLPSPSQRLHASQTVQLRLQSEQEETRTHTFYCALRRERPKTFVMVPLSSFDAEGELWEMRTWGDINASSAMTMVPSEVAKLIFKKDEVMSVDLLLLDAHSTRGCPAQVEAVVSSAWETVWRKDTRVAPPQRPQTRVTSTIVADVRDQSLDEVMTAGLQSLSGPRPPRTPAQRQPPARAPPCHAC